MAETKEWKIAQHRLWIEEPDIVWALFQGQVDIPQLDQMIAVYRERVATKGPFFLAANVANGHIDAACRKHLTDRLSPEWFLGTVYIGAGLIQRVMTKAISVTPLFKGPAGFETGFAEDENGARTWIAAERAKRPAQPRP